MLHGGFHKRTDCDVRNEGTLLRTGRRRAEMEKKKAPVKKAKKKKKVAEKRGVKTEESESLMGEEAGGGTGSGMDEGQTEDEAEDEEREHLVSVVTGNAALLVSSSSRAVAFISFFFFPQDVNVSKDLFIWNAGVSQETGSVTEKVHVNGEKSFLTTKKEERDEKKKDKSGLFVVFFFLSYFQPKTRNSA